MSAPAKASSHKRKAAKAAAASIFQQLQAEEKEEGYGSDSELLAAKPLVAPAAAAIEEMEEIEAVPEEEVAAPPPPAKKQVVEQGLVPVAVAAASSSALVPAGVMLEDTLFLDPDDDVKASFNRIYQSQARFVKLGRARVRNPDLFMALMSRALNMGIHLMDLDNPAVQFNVYRKDNKFINFARKGNQKDFSGKRLMGYNFVSAASTGMFFFKYGSTKETGVEGNRGKVIESKGKKIPTKPGEESYECTLGCEPIHPDMRDSNANNPIALMFYDGMEQLEKFVFGKIWSDKRNLVGMRNKLQELVDKKSLDKMPVTAEEAMAALRTHNLMLTKVHVSDSDPSAKHLTTSASCYRSPHKANDFGQKEEDVGKYEPPTEYFRKQMAVEKEENGVTKTVFRLWNELPAWRIRHPSEGVVGDPMPRIPTASVAFTKEDVLFEHISMGFYEESAKDQCSFKYTLEGFVYLNKKAEMEKMVLAELEPCDPMMGNPMAGPYGPAKAD
jgi:hypothetical protein